VIVIALVPPQSGPSQDKLYSTTLSARSTRSTD
jgi:hypothetical protein